MIEESDRKSEEEYQEWYHKWMQSRTAAARSEATE